VLQTFLFNWVQGVAYKNNFLGHKLAGVCAREASKKFGTPYLFLQPNVEGSNFNFGVQLGFDE